VKEVVQEGIGAWCDNPTDEGTAIVRIEEISTPNGNRLFPEGGMSALEFEVVVGNGQVCDALECALLVMKRHETAVVTCKDSTLCAGGPSFGFDTSSLCNGARFRMTLLDYIKGPDVWSFDEEERVKFAHRRKVEANRLFGAGRFHLARERYKRIIELFHHMNKKGFRDRFLGRAATLEQCRELCKHCRLNAAACSLRLFDPMSAKEFCDEVLRGDPENIKGLFRRAQAFQQRQDFVQACGDLTRVLDIEPSLEEARRLLEKLKQHRKASDRKQCKAFKFGSSIDGLNDPRSTKNDYMDTPMDLPGVEGQPVSSLWAPKTKAN
jgi:tetratricopeptide (TPR) repeat protein